MRDSHLQRVHEVAQHNVQYIEQSLRTRVEWLIRDMEGLLKNLDQGGSVSAIGEVQGQGGYIDSLCGRLSEARSMLRYLDVLKQEEEAS